MLNVHFPASLPIDPEDLADLLRITGVPLTVEPLVNGNAPLEEVKQKFAAKANGATPVKAAPAVPVKAAVAGVAPSEPPKRRGRPPKAAVAAAVQGMVPAEPAKRRGRPPKAAAPAEPVAVVGLDLGEPASTDDLLGRFSVLIDKSYEDAVNLLGNFGVARFGDLPETAYASFGKALGGLGV